jgi:hypothetical protein
MIACVVYLKSLDTSGTKESVPFASNIHHSQPMLKKYVGGTLSMELPKSISFHLS